MLVKPGDNLFEQEARKDKRQKLPGFATVSLSIAGDCTAVHAVDQYSTETKDDDHVVCVRRYMPCCDLRSEAVSERAYVIAELTGSYFCVCICVLNVHAECLVHVVLDAMWQAFDLCIEKYTLFANIW